MSVKAETAEAIRRLLDNPPDILARVWELGTDTELTELAGIAADVHALSDRVGDFLDAHRHDPAGCHCCTEIAKRSPGPPDLWSALEALRFTLWSAHGILDSERPKVEADLPHMIRVLERIKREDAAAADDTVVPDAVAEATVLME